MADCTPAGEGDGCVNRATVISCNVITSLLTMDTEGAQDHRQQRSNLTDFDYNLSPCDLDLSTRPHQTVTFTKVKHHVRQWPWPQHQATSNSDLHQGQTPGHTEDYKYFYGVACHRWVMVTLVLILTVVVSTHTRQIHCLGEHTSRPVRLTRHEIKDWCVHYRPVSVGRRR